MKNITKSIISSSAQSNYLWINKARALITYLFTNPHTTSNEIANPFILQAFQSPPNRASQSPLMSHRINAESQCCSLRVLLYRHCLQAQRKEKEITYAIEARRRGRGNKFLAHLLTSSSPLKLTWLRKCGKIGENELQLVAERGKTKTLTSHKHKREARSGT